MRRKGEVLLDFFRISEKMVTVEIREAFMK